MTTKQEEPANVLREEVIDKTKDSSKSQTSNENMQCTKDMDNFGELKAPPQPKKWFRKQFGMRKNAMQMDYVVNPQPTNTACLQNSRRRSSSLPDLASMLDAASLEKHGVCVKWTPGPLKTAKSRKRSRMTGSDSVDYLVF